MRERGLENDLEQKFEDLADKAGFEKLLAFASNMCLQSPIEQPPATAEYSENRAIIEQLGIRGLRVAVEMELGAEENLDEHKNLKENVAYLTVDCPVRYPNAFSGEFSYENAAQIEAFGKTLIGEAYDVLGSDADEYMEKFCRAANDQEQIEALEWLDARIREIVRGDYEIMEKDGDEPDYHPVRLSPKLMGRYPDITLPPTCLGASLIAAGFLDKAGAQYMNAGVMTSRRQYEMVATAAFFIMVPQIAKDRFDCAAPENIESALKQQSKKTADLAHEYSEYHAAIYTKLKSGSWYQLDPIFQSSSQTIFSKMDATLDRNYERLRDFQSIAPGMELAADMDSPGVVGIALDYLENIKPEAVPTINDVDVLLNNANTDTLADDVFEQLIVPFFADASNDEIMMVFDQSMREQVEHEGVSMLAFQCYYQQMFTKYVCGERTHEEFLQSLGDQDQRQEAIAALRFLPFLITANWANKRINSNNVDTCEHQVLEFGLPHHQLGAAVLSDIALHYDFGLSPKFWFSNWSSLVPVTASLHLDAKTRAQQALRYNNTYHTTNRQLTYRNSLGTIKSSLSSDTEE